MSGRRYEVAPPGKAALGLLTAAFAAAGVGAVLAGAMQGAEKGADALFVLIALIPVAALALGFAVWVIRRRSVVFESGELTVKATLHTRRVARSELDVDKARIVNLDDAQEFKPVLRMWGFGLPGFQAGHFWLKDRRRAFCLLTARDRVLVLPERSGRLILLSLERPQALLDALR